MSLLTPSELAAIQEIGQSGMTAIVEIYAQVFDTGNDLTDDPYGSSVTFSSTPSSTVSGWLVGTWATTRDTDVGDVDTSTLYRLRLPVGTEIQTAWRIVINGNEYNVIDAGTDQTWPEWLVCTVRRVK